jgi:hypothetical protein
LLAQACGDFLLRRRTADQRGTQRRDPQKYAFKAPIPDRGLSNRNRRSKAI